MGIAGAYAKKRAEAWEEAETASRLKKAMGQSADQLGDSTEMLTKMADEIEESYGVSGKEPGGPFYITAEFMEFGNKYAAWLAVKIKCECGDVLMIHTADPHLQRAKMAAETVDSMMAGNQVKAQCPSCGAKLYVNRPLIERPSDGKPLIIK